MSRRLLALVAVMAVLVGLVGLGWLATPPPASAHAVLVASTPEQGARLASAPAAVELTFSTALTPPAVVVVHGPDGSVAATDEPSVSGALVRQPLPDAGGGTYTVAYRVVTADGHPVTGQLTFSVAGTSPGSGPSASAADTGAGSTGAGSTGRDPATAAEPVVRRAADAGREPVPVLRLILGAGLLGLAALLGLLARRRTPTG